MKYLLVIAVVAVFYLYWKKQRAALRPPAPDQPPPLAPPQQMVACAHCGLHLPARDALLDKHSRSYCCTAHQQAGPQP